MRRKQAPLLFSVTPNPSTKHHKEGRVGGPNNKGKNQRIQPRVETQSVLCTIRKQYQTRVEEAINLDFYVL